MSQPFVRPLAHLRHEFEGNKAAAARGSAIAAWFVFTRSLLTIGDFAATVGGLRS